MTKEQDEAIEYFKKHIKYFEEQIKFIEATDCNYYDEELELYQNRVKQFNIVLSMLKEKDKQIDLMAEAISFIDTDIEVIQNQVKEQYCEFIKSDDDCCWKTNKACVDCIKQYFENKAKEVE